MPEIHITGADQREAFLAVSRIVSSEGISVFENGELGVDVEAGKIKHGNNVYVFTDNGQYATPDEMNDGAGPHMTPEGASWFANLRDTEAAIGGAQGSWESFLVSFSNAYRKKYFLTVYPKKRKEEGDELADKYGEQALALIQKLYPSLGNVRISRVPQGNAGEEDIYAVTLRMHISVSMGKAVPLIGTLYLVRHGDERGFRASRLTPMLAEDAEKIVSALTPAGVGERTPELMFAKDDTTTSTVISELTARINDLALGRDKRNIADYVVFDKRSAEKIEQMLSGLAEGAWVLSCTGVEVRAIANVRWEITNFDVVNAEGTHLFRITGGIDGKFSVRCLGCAESSEIMVNNRITGKNPKGEEETYTVDLSRDDLGLGDSVTEQLRALSTVAEHYNPTGTPACNNARIKGCPAYLCRSHLVTLDSGETVCRACLYPEVVLRDKEGRAHYSRSVLFALDVMDFLPAAQTQVCPDCKRTVRRTDSRLCELCEAIERRDNQLQARELYKKYSSALPVGRRIAAAGKTKLCYEDKETVVFIIEDARGRTHRYQLEKLAVLMSGRKAAPTEID